jgi:hypothetical protein
MGGYKVLGDIGIPYALIEPLKESGRNTARATLGSGLAVSAFPLDVPVLQLLGHP